MFVRFAAAALFLLPLSSPAAGNEKIASFREAKRLAAGIHREHPYTIYCGCRYAGKKIDLASCGYRPRKDTKRARRLEWEHVVPAENFGRAFVEWREGSARCVRKGRRYKGRKCAETNPEFNHMEGDLYNLWPEVGELNGLRNNYSMEALGGAEKNPGSSFGGCRAVVAGRKFEPMDLAKGIVARVYLYMDQAYPGKGIVSGKNRKLFEAWDKTFPPDAWECKRAGLIRKIQGNGNPVLEARCAEARSAKKKGP
jgi:deoxyribonuclease-1